MTDYRARYGVLSPNPGVDQTIYQSFNDLPSAVVHKLATRFRSQWGLWNDALHTFHETLVGAHLARSGYAVDYEREVADKTPDWTLMATGQQPAGIVEVVNHHLARTQEDALKTARAKGEAWSGMVQNTNRLWDKIDHKAGAYHALVTAQNLPHVVAVFGTFEAVVLTDEILACVEGDQSVFQGRSSLSGVWFAREECALFRFTYYPNANAFAPLALPSSDWSPH